MIFFMAAFLAAGCAKAPEWNGDASLSIEPVQTEAKEVKTDTGANIEKYSVKLFIRISNINSQTAYTGLKGSASLTGGSADMGDFPFVADMILPFGIESAVSEKELPAEKTMLLLDALGVDREKFLQDRTLSDHFLEKKDISVNISEYSTSGIIDLLYQKNKGK
jgi:hypothetical protein